MKPIQRNNEKSFKKLSLYDINEMHHLEQKVKNYVKLLTNSIKTMQINIDNCSQNQERSNKNILESYDLDFQFQQQFVNLRNSLSEGKITSMILENRKMLESNLKELGQKLAQIEDGQNKQKKFIISLSKMLEHVNQRLQKRNVKNMGVEASLQIIENDENKYAKIGNKFK